MSASVPPRVRIRFWGTRGTCPSPGPRTVRYGGNTPCVEVRGPDNHVIILDAGSGIRALGAHLLAAGHSTPIQLLLSHRHSDHVLGLAHFAPLFEPGNRIHVRCGEGEADALAAFTRAMLTPPLFPAVDGLSSRLDFSEWDDHDAPLSNGLVVKRFPARHPGEAAIFRFDDANGPLLAYAPDNELAYHDQSAEVRAWRAALADFLRGVPVLIHDATYRHHELPQHAGWGHSSHVEATRLALECGARTLVLFHHHPDRDDDSVEQMVEECRAQATRSGAPLRLLAAWEGLTLSV
ncbi:MBL fold metallo-hydrolase [Gemmatimonas sp.]